MAHTTPMHHLNTLIVELAWLLTVILLIIMAAGCAPGAAQAPPPPPFLHNTHPGAVPYGLESTARTLELASAIGILILAAAAALLVYCPAEHRLALSLATGAATLFLTGAVGRLTLWLLPIATAAGIIAAALYVWRKLRQPSPSSSPAAPATQPPVAGVAGGQNQLAAAA